MPSRAAAELLSPDPPALCRSSRYCPNEDHGGFGAPGFNWQNPFTAYNCTWGFRAPMEFPESANKQATDVPRPTRDLPRDLPATSQ